MEYGGPIIDETHDLSDSGRMYVEGRVLTTDGKPIKDAVIEAWETDENGLVP